MKKIRPLIHAALIVALSTSAFAKGGGGGGGGHASSGGHASASAHATSAPHTAAAESAHGSTSAIHPVFIPSGRSASGTASAPSGDDKQDCHFWQFSCRKR